MNEKLAGLSPAKRALLERMLKERADERAQDPRNQPIPKRAADAATPLSFNQGILWIMDQLQPGETAYNVPRASRVKGDLRLEVLQQTVDTLVARHEVIRTTYGEVGGTPAQIVNPPSPVTIRFTDLSDVAPDVREIEGDRLLVAASRYAFDLARDLMLRVDVIKMGPQDHILLLLTHHICSDGWSKSVLFREFSDLYDAFARGEPNPLPPLAIQYADFANWQRTGAAGDLLNKQVSYWKNRLAGAPSLLELPLDHPRPPVRTFAGSHQTLQLSRPLADALRALAQREGATPFMVGMAVFQVLMHRYTQQDDVSVGTPIAGRYRKELQGMIGFFTNTLVIRTDFSGNPTFRQLLGRVREAALGAYDHQELPFEKLVMELNPERSLSHTPLFQVMFVLQNLPPAERTPAGLTMTQVKSERGNSKFDLMLSMIEHADGMTGSIEYATDLFDPATITRMCGHFRTLVESIVANPDQEVALLPMLMPAERDQLLHAFNDTKADFPTERCLPELVEEQVARTPDAIAVVAPDGAKLTYRALNARANQLAQHLRALGVGPEVKVGIAIKRSLDMVVGLLGILKAGGACVPLDPTYPEDRLRLMIEEAALPFVVTEAAFVEVLPKSAAKLIQIDADGAGIGGRSQDNPPPAARPADLGYVLFTSGSTGRPKGVLLSHKGLANFCCAAVVRYGVTSADRVLQFATINFDAHIEEIYPSLMTGATLHLRDDEMIASTAHFSRWTKQHRITLLDLPTAYWHEWVRELSATGETLDPHLRALIVGGEQSQTAAYAAWMKVQGARNVRWFNTAAPTECTVVTAVYEGDRDQVEVPVELPIGRPIGNTTSYVLDERQNPVPIGVCGEWVIGGAGVARGYLDRPELTAEKFIPDPWSNTPGARMYRTGDRARYLPDGNIVLMGRVDQQVKLRGFRIELGEIETVLGGHPAVGQSAVIAREDTPGTKRLVAYVVLQQGSSVGAPELKAFLKAKLPEYMVPSAIVFIDALPLTANGKVNRKALPAPDRSGFEADDQFIAPRTPIEEMVTAMWIEILGIPRVGVQDNFFYLGGHSLLATRVISKIRDVFTIELPLRRLFESPTVEAIAAAVTEALSSRMATGDVPPPRIEGLSLEERAALERELLDKVAGAKGREARAAQIPRRTSTEPALLSFGQRRLWFLEKFEPDTGTYNIPRALRVRGPLDVAALRAALNAIVARHEALRTIFTEQGGQPVQQLRPEASVDVREVDLSPLPGPARDEAFSRLMRDESRRPFNIATDLMLRAMVVRLGADDHGLLIVMHHIASDGWSMAIFIRELVELYDAHRAGRAAKLPELPIQYADFSVWQRQWLSGPELGQQLEYWKQQLSGAATLEMPTDRPRPAVMGNAGERQTRMIPASTHEAIQALGKSAGTTSFMTLLAAFHLLLHRYTDQTDISVGSPIAGRTRAETEGLIGFFINTLVLRADLSGDPTFPALLARVKEVALSAFAHQEIPFERLVEQLRPERSTSRSPLFQVMFVLQSAPQEKLELAGLSMEGMDVESNSTKFDLSMYVYESAAGLKVNVTYNTDLFDGATIARLLGHYQTLLESIAAHPELPISKLPILSHAETEQLLVTWNQTGADFPRQRVHDLVTEQAARTPAAVALSRAGEEATYAELDRRSNQLARLLQRQGVRPDSLVGIFCERSIETVIGMLAVLKAGGAYVPLDPAYPRDRVAFMVDHSGLSVILTHEALVTSLPDHKAHLIRLDADRPLIDAEDPTKVESPATPESLAYVLYTSGSTGKPKGVQIEHRALVNFLNSLKQRPGMTSSDRVLAVTSFSFDITGLEIWLPLTVGGQTEVASVADAMDGERLSRMLEAAKITVLQGTPTTFQLLATTGWRAHPGLKVVVGGEAVPRELATRLCEQGATTWNGYGPTETTIYSTFQQLSAEPGPVYIGRPVHNTQVYILDAARSLVPIGVPGELHIGGAGLARGYLGRPDLTAERFIQNPFDATPGTRLYRTGDLARYRPDGTLEFLGRIDHQVKLRGYRIELGEIEAVLGAHPAVREVVAVVRGDDPANPRLCAYLALRPSQTVSPAELRDHVRQKLPDYMVPSAFVTLDALPRTPNSKIDRKALPAPDRSDFDADDRFVAPRTPIEEMVAGMWIDILGVARVSVQDNFFDLGGHSLLATRVISKIRDTFNIEFPLRRLFEAPTVEATAAAVSEAVAALVADEDGSPQRQGDLP